MQRTLMNIFLKPMLRRMGTSAGVILIGMGLDADLVGQLLAAAGAAAGIGFDLFLSYLDKRIDK